MLFHEIYGCYYQAVAEILSLALEGELTEEKARELIARKAFSESVLTILPALKNEEWQLLDDTLHTPLKYKPSLPLTLLQKRWLKAISLDPRMRLFKLNFEWLADVQPLFTPEDFVLFDQYQNGDPYEDEFYIRNFRIILEAVKKHRKVSLEYQNRKGSHQRILCDPYKLEYSEKDDKFRAIVFSRPHTRVLNLSGILACKIVGYADRRSGKIREHSVDSLVLELTDERNALERVMLHFAHFAKEAECIAENRYRVRIYYDREDRTELVIRVLSFGPFVKVVEPEEFVSLVRKRLSEQKSCGLL